MYCQYRLDLQILNNWIILLSFAGLNQGSDADLRHWFKFTRNIEFLQSRKIDSSITVPLIRPRLAIKNPRIGGFYWVFLNAIKLACIQQDRICKIHQAHKWNYPVSTSCRITSPMCHILHPEIMNRLDLSSITYFSHCFVLKMQKQSQQFQII